MFECKQTDAMLTKTLILFSNIRLLI